MQYAQYIRNIYSYTRTRYPVTMEKRIEKYLTFAVKKRGGLCLKLAPFFFRGLPDRLVLLPDGVALFVELKSQGERPSRIQGIVHARLRDLGFRVEVLDSYESIDNFILGL